MSDPATRPYLSAEQLAELVPWSADAIEKMIRRGTLVRGVHYFQPFGRRGRLLFKWKAIEALIEGRTVQDQTRPVLEGDEARASRAANAKRTIDVEKATTELQRLLA